MLSNDERVVCFGSSRLGLGDASNRVRPVRVWERGSVEEKGQAVGVGLQRLNERGLKSTCGGGCTIGVSVEGG